MASQGGVESVDRALTLVKCCVEADGPLSLADLFNRSGFYKSTILRLAVSLESFGYLHRRGDGRFVPGAELARMARIASLRIDLGSIVRPALKTLAVETCETASLYVRRGDLRECLFRHEPDRAIRHSVTEGSQFPLTGGASAHIINAWTGRHRDDASGDLPHDARSLGERDPEVAAIAVPVFGSDGMFFAALSVSGLVTRFADGAACDQMVSTLQTTADYLNSAHLFEDAP